MQVPSRTTNQVQIASGSSNYLQAARVDTSGITQGFNAIAGMVAQRQSQLDKRDQFDAVRKFSDFETQAKEQFIQAQRDVLPDQQDFETHFAGKYDNFENEFIAGLKPELQDEFRTRANEVRNNLDLKAVEFGNAQRDQHFKNGVEEELNKGKIEVDTTPSKSEEWKSRIGQVIDSSGLSELDKENYKRQAAEKLETIAYQKAAIEDKTLSASPELSVKFLIERGTGNADEAGIRGLNPVFSTRLAKLTAAAEAATGKKATIVDAQRSIQRQAQYYEAYKNGSGGLAAPPGRSRHQHGNAADIQRGEVLSWMHKNASKYGLEFLNGEAFAKDPVHIQLPKGIAADGDTSAPAGSFTFPSLVKAVRTVESGNGANNVTSSAGAAGPMQVMPTTAKEIAAELGDNNFPSNGTDAQIREYLRVGQTRSGQPAGDIYGQHYLDKMIKQNGGDVELALIAYNGGQKRADEFVAAGRDSSVLPAETAAYVQKVFGHMGVPDTLDEDPRYANVPYEDRLSARQVADTQVTKLLAEQHNQLLAQNASAVNNLMVNIEDGVAGKAEVDRLRATGTLTDYTDIHKAYSAIEARDKEGQNVRDTLTKIKNRVTLDPNDSEDKKGLNSLLGKEGKTALINGDEDYLNNILLPLFKSTAAIPSDAISTLTSMISDLDPARQKFAMNALASLQNLNPVGFTAQVPSDIAKKLDQWNLLNGVLPPEDLYKAMKGGSTPEERNNRQSLDKQYDETIAANSGKLAPKLQTILDHFDPTSIPFAGDAVAPNYGPAKNAIEAEAKALVKENYIKMNGDLEAAWANTFTQLDRDWGVSTVGGLNTLMKHPPEKMYPSMTVEQLREQLREDTKLTEDTQFELVSDDRTFAEGETLKKWDGKGQRPTPPSYRVATLKDGKWDILKNDVGIPLRQFFEKTPAMKAVEVVRDDLNVLEKDLNEAGRRYEEAFRLQQWNGITVPEEIKNNFESLKAARTSFIEQNKDKLRKTDDSLFKAPYPENMTDPSVDLPQAQ